MSEQHTVHFVTADGRDAGVGTFILSRTDDQRSRLQLHYGELRLEAVEGDFFKALCTLRTVLEEHGVRPSCYGASRRVFSAGLGRDMGEGLVGHKLTLGEQCGEKTRVFIFDDGDDVEPATVHDQWAFFKSWWDGHVPDHPLPESPPWNARGA